MEQVKITRAGDSSFRVGQVISLERFLTVVGQILQAGGEMPIALLEPS